MTRDAERSGNEIETLVLKAARGGGLALGLAEDLAAATPFLNLEELRVCPCRGETPAAQRITSALDRMMVDGSPCEIDADYALIVAYASVIKIQYGIALAVEPAPNGVRVAIDTTATDEAPTRLGRRAIPASLWEHLAEMAAKTLVPETDASRARGAGAGLTDND